MKTLFACHYYTWLYGCLNLQDDPSSSPLIIRAALKTGPQLDLYFELLQKNQDFPLTSSLEKYGEKSISMEKLALILYVVTT